MSDKLKILFLHGKEGTPEGHKPTYMRANGHWVIAPVLPKDDFALSLRRAYNCLDAFKPDVIVGSSRGGAVACALETVAPKILIAPAYNSFHVKNPIVDETTTILHCPDDDLVPYEDSCLLVDAYDCNLIACGDDHRMSDPTALNELLYALTKVTK